MKAAWFVLVIAGCGAQLADEGRRDPGATPSDAEVDATADAFVQQELDAPSGPNVAMFAVGAECNGSHCTGGYGGKPVPQGAPTADHLCTTHAFARATSYTFSNQQPGGRFCTYAPTSAQQFQCDSDCSGCNAINSVTCANP
jgi:hypothetical protein